MSDSDDNTKQAASLPAWQQAASRPAQDASPETTSTESIRDRARTFLQDDEVRTASREKKIEFLRSKGLEEADITELLDESTPTPTDTPTELTTIHPQPSPTTSSSSSSSSSSPSPPSPEPAFAADTQPAHPPIVTYPEFLTKPTKPPPLITAAGLLNALALIGGASALVYGATKHIVSPMVAALTDARVDLHHAADANLARLVTALEGAVSEIPPAYYASGRKNNPHNSDGGDASNHKKKPAGEDADDDDDDDESTYDDPSELFHRDVGVQTSPRAPSTPNPQPSFLPSHHHSPSSFAAQDPSTASAEQQTQHQADRLARLATAIRGLDADVVHHAEALADTKGVLDALATDLHALTYPPESFGAGSSYIYGAAAARSAETDDEIGRVKKSIRAVKGVLLSTKSFPASTR